MIGSLYFIWITFLVLLFSIAEGTWPIIASKITYRQILETKTLMANVISPSKDQLAVIYKSGIEFYRLDVQIYNISGSSLIPFLNQTLYADNPTKIFWLQIGYFMVTSLSRDSIYRILFFKVGGPTSTQFVVSPVNIYWSDWSTVLRENGVDYIFQVKSWIASKYKILGIDKFELVAKRNILLQQSQLPSDVIIWIKFKHLNCYYSNLLKQNILIPYLQCLDFSSNYNDSFKLQPRGNMTTAAIKYLPHPSKSQIYAIFKGDNVIYQISVPIQYDGKDINNQSITVKPFGKINPNLELLSIDMFGQSIVILAEIPGNQVEPERCLLFFKIDDSLYFYQILRIQKNYTSFNGFNKISQLSQQRLLINFNYQASQFSRIFLMFTNEIKNSNETSLILLIIALCLFYGIFFFGAYYSYRSWHFAKLHLTKNVRQHSFIVELICFTFVYLIAYFQVLSTNLNTQVQQNFDYYSSSRLVGSYFTRLLYHLFYFTTTICMIFQLYYQFEYANKHLGYHIKHGLKKIHYVCYRITKTYIKAFIHSIISVFVIYGLELGYCLSNYKVFQVKQLLLIIIIYQVSMVSATMFAILASKSFSSFWLASSAILLVQFQISYLVETFYMIEQVKLVEHVLIFIWPQAVFSAFLQALLKIQLRYLEENIQFEHLGIASVLLLLITCIAYFLIIRNQLLKKDFNKLVKKKGFDEEKQLLNRNGFNISDVGDIRTQNQVPFLDVFIPCKLNLKNRLEKNSILEDVRFTAGKGPQGEIHSFIDFGNESKAALFKILINDEQSDTQIQSQIEGHVHYRQRVSLSYCFDKDIFYPELTVKEHLGFYAFLKNYKAKALEIEEQVQKILNQFNIPDQFINKRAKNLSGGYLKKMCLACAFIGDPQVIILDEPTVGLDLKFQKLFWQKVRQWKRKKLIIIFTSNISQAQSISDSIWYFEKAKLLNYHQMQMKKKKLEITLEFKTNNQLNQASQMIRKFKRSTHAIEKKYIQQKLFKSQLLLYRFQSKGIRQQINQLVTQILISNKRSYTCHLSFKISQNLMGPKQLVQYYKFGQQQRFNDRIQLIQLLKTNFTQNNSYRYSGVDENDKYEGVQIINKLRNIERVKSRVISQIKAVIYRRNTMRKNLHLNQAETIVTQFYLWFHLIVIIMTYNTYSSNYDSRQEFLKSISIYLILHSKMNHFYIREKVEQFKECQQSIGLSYKFYWLGNYIFDFCNLLLPIIISILVIMILQFFLSVSLLIDVSELLFTSFIFCGGYILTVIILSQFLSNQIQMHTVLMAFLLFPIYLHEDSYFDLCTTNQKSFFQSIGLYFYPWTVRDWFIDKNSYVSYLSLSVQFVIFSLTIYFIEIIKKFLRNRQSHKFFKNYVNVNNKFIDDEKKIIEDCNNKQEFIIGQNIIKFYDKNQSLKNVYFRVKRGEMIGFFGHNGCGKTTLFRIIVGRLSQSSGIIKYFGKQKKDISDSEKLEMSYCPQLDQFDHNLTLQQNIRVIGRIKGLDNKYISRFIAVFARFLSLKGNEQVFMGQLSVNERKKANIMAAFLGFPKIIVLDQTSTGLDSDTSQRILRLLKIYANEFNNCVLLTSHNISEGQQFCNRVIIIKDGIIKASGTPSALKNGPQQGRYKLVVYFKRGSYTAVNKQLLIQCLKDIEFKMTNIDERYRLGFSFDFASDLLQVFKSVWHLYERGCFEKFSFYKHDLEEVAKFNMNQEKNDPSNSIVIQ